MERQNGAVIKKRLLPKGYFHSIRRSEVGVGGGGLDLASSLEARFGVRSPNKRKNLGSSSTTIGKNFYIIPSIQENTLPMRIHRDLPHRFWGHI